MRCLLVCLFVFWRGAVETRGVHRRAEIVRMYQLACDSTALSTNNAQITKTSLFLEIVARQFYNNYCVIGLIDLLRSSSLFEAIIICYINRCNIICDKKMNKISLSETMSFHSGRFRLRYWDLVKENCMHGKVRTWPTHLQLWGNCPMLF